MARSFIVPGRLPTLNAWRNQHFYKQNSDKQYWQGQILLSLKATNVPKPLRCPITIKSVVCTVRARDVDGGGLGPKFCGDTLKENGYIKDDSAEYVEFVMMGWKKAKSAKEEQVNYTIYEAGETV